MNIDILKKFSDRLISEYAQFMDEYNSQMIKLNAILDEKKVTKEAIMLGREVLQSAIDFHNNKLNQYREEVMNEEANQLIINDTIVYNRMKDFENKLLESNEKSYAEMLNFIRTYEFEQARTQRNEVLQVAAELMRQTTSQINKYAEDLNKQTAKLNDGITSSSTMADIRGIFQTHITCLEDALNKFKTQVISHCFSNKFTEEEKQNFAMMQNLLNENLVSTYKCLINNV